MRHLAFACASISALLFAPAAAQAACQPPTVDWSKFQQAQECVGGVIAFVAAEWGLPFPATGGHATHDGCQALGACIEWVYQLPINQAPEAGHWNAHAWGSVPAQAYDIAVFGPIAGDAYGHIALIDHVDGNTLWLMDDNWGGYHEKSCAWEGRSGWVHSTTWQPYGFFRRKDAEPCGCKAGAVQTEACACGSRSRTCSSCEWGDWGACELPDYAASLVDVSYPQTLPAGEQATVWADFRNVGTTPWAKDGIWLGAQGKPDGGASALFSPADSWPAWDVSAVLGAQVMPGDVGRFSFAVTAPPTPGATIAETFQLQVPGGPLISCPAAEITPSIQILPGVSGAGGAGGAGASADLASPSSAGGCSQVPSGNGWSWGAEITLALLMLARARRTSRLRAVPVRNGSR